MQNSLPEEKQKTAIFIMPALSSDWQDAEGLWVTTAGWAAAAKKKFGNSIIVTRDRIASAEEVLEYPLLTKQRRKDKRNWYSFLPSFFKILVKDIISFKNSREWDILERLKVQENDVVFVWEKHDLFSGSGIKLAKRYNVPYISYVHAPVIWEASKWGVKRYLWGRFLEKREATLLRKADYVAVVSKEVKQKIVQLGVREDRIFISPMAVDPEYFQTSLHDKNLLRRKLGLQENTIIGWIGSFRNFHGLGQVIKGFKKISGTCDSVLLLVGDGAERSNMEKLVLDLGLAERVIFTGKVPFKEISKFISLFDVAVVSAKTANDFHYSPQKLREYMATCKPVLAPDAGEIPLLFEDEIHLKLFTVGDVDSISQGMEFFLNDKNRSSKIAEAGKELILNTGTWERELEKCIKFMKLNQSERGA